MYVVTNEAKFSVGVPSSVRSSLIMRYALASGQRCCRSCGAADDLVCSRPIVHVAKYVHMRRHFSVLDRVNSGYSYSKGLGSPASRVSADLQQHIWNRRR